MFDIWPSNPLIFLQWAWGLALHNGFALLRRRRGLEIDDAECSQHGTDPLTAAGAVFGLIALLVSVERTAAWYRDVRERRHELAVNTVTPERLIARCGAAEQDVSKAVYPILLRTMSYPSRGNRALSLAFSRTAEERSDWVFLSMKDENGSSYDTADAKIAALPCLDSAK